MTYIYERAFNNLKHTCIGWSYKNFDDVLKDLIYAMKDKIGHPSGDQYRNLKFVMNLPFYHEFLIACRMLGRDSDMYRGIPIIQDSSLYIGDTQSPDGIVKLIYEEEPEIKYDDLYLSSIRKATNSFFLPSAKPHIDHVKFNGPATIVFWKDGTKTIVKHDGKGRKDKRQAILYAFIRKIYGESNPYHNILNEIEEAIK